MSGVACRHHILGVEHLLCQLWDCKSSVLLGAPGGQGSESRHEEMQSWEGNHVDCQLSQVSVELSREPEASGHTGHCKGDQVVQIAVGGGGKFQCPEANVIQSFVVNAKCFICVLHKWWTESVAL